MIKGDKVSIRNLIRGLLKIPALNSPRVLLGLGPPIYDLYVKLTGNYMGKYTDAEVTNAATASAAISASRGAEGITGEYTTRLIVLGHLSPLEPEDFSNFPSEFRDYEFRCGTVNPEDCSKEHGRSVCGLIDALSRKGRGEVIDSLRRFIRGDDGKNNCRFEEVNPPCRFIRTLAEEYAHSMIFSGTSMATLIDQYYWRLRLNTLYITEVLYETLNMPRNVDRTVTPIDHVIRFIENNEPKLRELPKPFYEAVEESIRLYILKETYASLALPFIEIPTWVSLGFYMYDDGDFDDALYEGRISSYFGSKEGFYRDAPGRIYELSKGKDPVKIIEAANRALDPPVSEIREIKGLIKGGDAYGALKKLLERYERALNGEYVKVSNPLAKSVLTSLSYALTGNREVKRNFIKLMREEPQVFKHLVNRLMIRGEYPERPGTVMYVFTYMDIGGQVYKFDCGPVNPQYGVRVNRTQRLFAMLEDLVGDGVIQFITMLRILENLGQDPNKEGNYLNALAWLLTVNTDPSTAAAIRSAWYGVINEVRNLFKDLMPKLSVNCHGVECYNLLLNRAMIRWPGLDEDYRLEFLLRVVESWLLTLRTLGAYFAGLPEYHGMWA